MYVELGAQRKCIRLHNKKKNSRKTKRRRERGSGKRPREKDIPGPAVASGGIFTKLERLWF